MCPNLFFKSLVKDLVPLMCLASFQSRQFHRKAFSQAVTLHYHKRQLFASPLIHLPTQHQDDRSWYSIWIDRCSCQIQSSYVPAKIHLLANRCIKKKAQESLLPLSHKYHYPFGIKRGVGNTNCFLSNHLSLHSIQNLPSSMHFSYVSTNAYLFCNLVL